MHDGVYYHSDTVDFAVSLYLFYQYILKSP